MLTENIVVDRDQALALYRKYRAHQHYSKPIDKEIQRTYQLISQGRLIIKALASVVAAGVGEDGYPKLAIGRAHEPKCYLAYTPDGSARMMSDRWVASKHCNRYIDFPAGSFPVSTERYTKYAEALTPLIPIDLRPKRGLENYHILWEAVWAPSPSVDPILLRRIGKQPDLWVVVAQWDLTEIERVALAARL